MGVGILILAAAAEHPGSRHMMNSLAADLGRQRRLAVWAEGNALRTPLPLPMRRCLPALLVPLMVIVVSP